MHVTGLFRVGELLQLTAANIDIAGSHLEITVKRSKTDQYGLGNKVFIAKTNGHACPHGLLSRYFALAGILPHSDEYILPRNQFIERPFYQTCDHQTHILLQMSRDNKRNFGKSWRRSATPQYAQYEIRGNYSYGTGNKHYLININLKG